MSKFKDIIQKDVNNIFFNNNEFSDYHVYIDETKGTVSKVHAIIDEMELIERNKGSSKEHQEGIFLEQNLIYIPCDEIVKPKIGKIIKLDNRRYSVTNVTEENGIYSLTVQSNKS